MKFRQSGLSFTLFVANDEWCLLNVKVITLPIVRKGQTMSGYRGTNIAT